MGVIRSTQQVPRDCRSLTLVRIGLDEGVELGPWIQCRCCEHRNRRPVIRIQGGCDSLLFTPESQFSAMLLT